MSSQCVLSVQVVCEANQPIRADLDNAREDGRVQDSFDMSFRGPFQPGQDRQRGVIACDCAETEKPSTARREQTQTAIFDGVQRSVHVGTRGDTPDELVDQERIAASTGVHVQRMLGKRRGRP